jgi:hypothetical protein
MRRKLGSIGAAITAWQVAMAVREHWLSIPRTRRDRLAELILQSRLQASNLSPAQRAELRDLIGAMRLPVLGRRLAGIAAAKRRGRRL